MQQNPPPFPVQNAKFSALEALRQAQLLTVKQLGEMNATLCAIVERLDKITGQRDPDRETNDAVAAATARNTAASKKQTSTEKPDSAA